MFAGSLEDVDKMRLERRGYTVKSVLEQGMNSTVYLVESGPPLEQDDQASSQKILACKVVDSAKMPKTLGMKFFLRELDIMTKIAHPHIIHVHSILQANTKFIIFMRYAENGNLCNWLLSHGPLTERQTRAWIRQVVVALLYLHTLDIAHRDLKCENILITSNHNIKLTDFGFARLTVNRKGKEVLSSTFCGSLAYAAPELLRGTKYLAKQADLWSLGIVLFIMLNASMPFGSSNLVQYYTDQVTKNYRFRTAVRPNVSQHAVDIVSSLLEPEPACRLHLEDFLSSRWMRSVLKYRQLTEEEQIAQEAAMATRAKVREAGSHKLNLKSSFTLLKEGKDSIESELHVVPSMEATPSLDELPDDDTFNEDKFQG